VIGRESLANAARFLVRPLPTMWRPVRQSRPVGVTSSIDDEHVLVNRVRSRSVRNDPSLHPVDWAGAFAPRPCARSERVRGSSSCTGCQCSAGIA